MQNKENEIAVHGLSFKDFPLPELLDVRMGKNEQALFQLEITEDLRLGRAANEWD